MLYRALRAALLNGSLYRELSDEPQEIFYALGIVAISGLALGLGLQSQSEIPLRGGASSVLVVLFSVQTRFVGWFLCAGVAYIVGTKLLGGEAGFRQLLRGLGMTFGPGVLAVFAGIPVVGIVFLGLSFLWLFPAGWIAIQETQRYDRVRTFICLMFTWFIGVGGSYFFLLILIGEPSVS